MARTIRRMLVVALALVGLAAAPAALAIANLEVIPTGERAGETTVRLFAADGGVVAPAPGNPGRYTGLTSGTYSAEVVVGGRTIGPRTSFQLPDGDHRLSASSDTGAIGVTPTRAIATPGERPTWTPAKSGPALAATVSWQQTNVPSMTSGTLVPGGVGSERSAVAGEREVTSPWFRVSMGQSPFGDLAFSYAEGNETTTHVEPVGGANIGYIYYQPSVTGSLGLNAGPTGATFRVNTDVKALNLAYTLPWYLHRSAPDEHRWYSEIRPELLYENQKTTWWSTTTSTSIAGLSMDANQRVREHRYGIGLRGQHTRPFGGGWSGGVTLRGNLWYRDADLDSTQSNVCTAPGCSPAATFTAINDDSDRGWTWGASIDANLDYMFTPRTSLGLEAGFHYRDETAVVKNPVSTINIDRPPHLDTGHVEFWRLGLVLRYQF